MTAPPRCIPRAASPTPPHSVRLLSRPSPRRVRLGPGITLSPHAPWSGPTDSSSGDVMTSSTRRSRGCRRQSCPPSPPAPIGVADWNLLWPRPPTPSTPNLSKARLLELEFVPAPQAAKAFFLRVFGVSFSAYQTVSSLGTSPPFLRSYQAHRHQLLVYTTGP